MIDGGFEVLFRSKQALAGHTRKIGLVENGENEPPAAPLYLIGHLILCGKRRCLAFLKSAKIGSVADQVGFEHIRRSYRLALGPTISNVGFREVATVTRTSKMGGEVVRQNL